MQEIVKAADETKHNAFLLQQISWHTDGGFLSWCSMSQMKMLASECIGGGGGGGAEVTPLV